MVTPVIHAKTEPLRELLKQLDAAPMFAKAPYVREVADRTLTLLAETLHHVDQLDARLAALERFPEADARS
jgi:hypothetical protein